MTAGQRPAQAPPPHPELDTLADLDAGVLDDADAERVAAHVATCAHCGKALAALEDVRTELRALPAPPIPAAVAARLDSTLAELSAAPHEAHADRPAAAAAPRMADLAAARDRRWRRLKAATGAAAAALALVVAGASITWLVRAGGGDSLSAEGGGGSAGGGQEHQSSVERQDSAAAPGAPPVPNSLPALPSFDRTTLRAALPSIEASTPLARVTDAGRSGPAGAMADAALRTACTESIPGRAGVLRAVRWIRYNGQPAYLFIFEDAGVRVAYVVGEQCGRAPAVPATVLDTVR